MTIKFVRPIAATLALCLSAGAFAGVQDKKAKRVSDENAAKQTVVTKTACGNKELKVNISWADYAKFVADPATAKEIESARAKTQHVYAKAGEHAESTLKALAKLCKDKDYQEELAKIKLIKITPQAGYKKGKTIFTISKDSTTLNVAAGHYYSRTPSDFLRKIKKLY